MFRTIDNQTGTRYHNNMQNIELLKQIANHFGGVSVNRTDLHKYCAQINVPVPSIIGHVKVGRGEYDLTRFTGDNINKMAATVSFNAPPAAQEFVFELDERTDLEILKEIQLRFDGLDTVVRGIINGSFGSAIASGNPGIGKTYSLERELEVALEQNRISKFELVKGLVKATGVYKLLYEFREKGNVIVFDDADSVFQDEVSLNLLKAALDTGHKRVISWRAETKMETADGERLPTSFNFDGSIIFVTNLDFDALIAKETKLSPHLAAMISRSLYIDLNLNNRELVARIHDVVENTDMLYAAGIYETMDRARIMAFFDSNVTQLREVSLRMILKLAKLFRSAANYDEFAAVALSTCTKRK